MADRIRQKERDDSFVVAAKIAERFKVDPLVRDVRAAADEILTFATSRAADREARDAEWDAAIEAAAAKIEGQEVECYACGAESSAAHIARSIRALKREVK